MKYKYDTLTKEEKNNLTLEFKESNDENKNFYKKINKIKIISYIGIAYSIIMMIIDFLFDMSLINKILDSLLLIFCILFLIKTNDILRMKLTKYLIKKKK